MYLQGMKNTVTVIGRQLHRLVRRSGEEYSYCDGVPQNLFTKSATINDIPDAITQDPYKELHNEI